MNAMLSVCGYGEADGYLLIELSFHPRRRRSPSFVIYPLIIKLFTIKN